MSGQVGSVSWKDFTEGSMKSSETTVTVIVLPSKEENVRFNQVHFQYFLSIKIGAICNSISILFQHEAPVKSKRGVLFMVSF
jgi:hypothetical protein